MRFAVSTGWFTTLHRNRPARSNGNDGPVILSVENPRLCDANSHFHSRTRKQTALCARSIDGQLVTQGCYSQSTVATGMLGGFAATGGTREKGTMTVYRVEFARIYPR